MNDCRTRYPLVLVHGLNCRPGRQSAFGRVPDDLRAHGATVFVTAQDAVGTVDGNARQLAVEIEQICVRTGSPKVNLIAHSKGGIEARRAISALGSAEHVASLSMLSTPNRGLHTVSRLARTPLFDVLSLPVDLCWRINGDDAPDFAAAARELTGGAMDVFNASHPDAPGIYYQSWGAALGGTRKDPLMSAFGLVFDRLDGQTDGMVSPASARWGAYRGTLSGITHQCFCDVFRRDTGHFDVRAFYRALAADLAKRGF